MVEKYNSKLVEDIEIAIDKIKNDIETNDILVEIDDTVIRCGVNIDNTKVDNISSMFYHISVDTILSNPKKELNKFKKYLIKGNDELIKSKNNKKLMTMKKYTKIDNNVKRQLEKYNKGNIHKLENNKEFMIKKMSGWLK